MIQIALGIIVAVITKISRDKIRSNQKKWKPQDKKDLALSMLKL